MGSDRLVALLGPILSSFRYFVRERKNLRCFPLSAVVGSKYCSIAAQVHLLRCITFLVKVPAAFSISSTSRSVNSPVFHPSQAVSQS